MISPSEGPDGNSGSQPTNSESTATPQPIDPDKTKATDDIVTSTTNNTNTLDNIDPSQLVFRLGLSPSPSKNDGWLPNNVQSPSSVNSSIGSSSSDRPGHVPDLFGSYVRASASNVPRRFNFESSPTSVASKLNQQAKPGDGAGFTSNYHVQQQPPPIIPNLGPDVTIRPVSAKNIGPKKFEANSKKNAQQKPVLDSNEVFKLLSGYNHLTSEVASLKTQLAEKETLIHEILGNFSSEVARLNNRLTSVEKELRKTRKRQNIDTQEDIATQLHDMSLLKKNEDNSD